MSLLIKKISLLLLLLPAFCRLQAQVVPVITAFDSASGTAGQGYYYNYGNDWYDPAQNYYKFLVAEEGVYRVSLSDLQTAGINTSGLVPANLHLIRRGIEQKIYVKDSAGTLQFLEFFGHRNDGREDSLMYRDSYSHLFVPDQVTNVNRSLFTDTAAYFIFWDNLPGQRMAESGDTNFSAYTAEPLFRYEHYQDAVGLPYIQGGANDEEPFSFLNSDYVPGEGFPGNGFDPGGIGFYFLTPHPANSGRPHEVKARLFSYSSAPIHERRILINSNEIYRDTVIANVIKTASAQDNTMLFAGITLGFDEVQGPTNDVKESRVAWFTFRYDRQFILDGSNEVKMVDWSNPANAYFHFTSTGAATDGVIYDLTTQTRITGQVSPGDAHFIVPGSATSSRTLFFSSGTSIRTPVIVPYTRLSNYSNRNQSAEFIIITHRKFQASAQAYEDYRENNAPTQRTTRVVYTDEIYDEFGYGDVTPQAIQRFCKYLLHEWQGKPGYFMLWGRTRGNHRFHEDDFVPTWGMPAGDVQFVSNWYPNVLYHTPEAAIGRINIATNQQGFDYLDKVVEYETMPAEPWMKNAMLMAGGGLSSSQIGYAMVGDSNPTSWANVMRRPEFSGNVYWLRQQGSNIVTNSNLPTAEIINNGVSLLNFFGHSTQSIFELDLRDPSAYSNTGKCPLLIAMGCNSGDFTTAYSSLGELYVLEPQKGAIGVLANASLGTVHYLKAYGDVFYDVQFQTHYGQSIGDVVKETTRRYLLNVPNGEAGRINHGRQMNLQADPAIVIRFPQLPDVFISNSDLFLTPGNFSAQDNQFTLNIVAHNTGSMPQDSFRISVRHITPSGSVIQYPSQLFPPFAFVDTFSLSFTNTLGAAMAGQNEFEVTLDSGNVISEYREDNNIATLRTIVPGVSPAILFPPEYAIIPTSTVELAASAVIMSTQPSVEYVYEIDTTHFFTSPAKIISGTISGTPVYSSWQVPGTLIDSQVYYWRVRIATVWPVVWTTSSFRYVNAITGWSQSAPPQFFKDLTNQMSMDQLNQVWKFLSQRQDLHCYIEPTGEGQYFLGTYTGIGLAPAGTKFTPISQRTLIPSIQNTISGDWTLMISPDGEPDVITKIQDLPVGDWMLMVSQYDPLSQNWSPALLQALEQIGVTAANRNALAMGTQFIILGRKGFPNGAIVITDPNLQLSTGVPIHDLQYQLTAPWRAGTIQSTLIGPALSWQNFSFDWHAIEGVLGDSLLVDVYGVRQDMTDTLLFSGLSSGSYSLASVDATAYPRMRLIANATDAPFATAPQLDEWTVLFEAAPDAAVDPTVNYSFNRDTVAEGEVVTMSMAARNLTPLAMDSLLVSFTVERSDRTQLVLDSVWLAPLVPNGLLNFSYAFNTAQKQLVGDLTFIVEINPGFEQPEMYAFNNIYYKRFRVEADKVNPLLDVTFNGKHILEGDLISPLPEIRIEVNDENAWLPVLINDTTFEVFFGMGRSPSQLTQIHVEGNPLVERVNVRMSENRSAIIFRPGRLADGEYTLKVMGRDYSGNEAGTRFYEAHFNVVNESTMSQVLNYPNPFSSLTRFVYTLTGSELPEKFEIRIFTITGKLVKVIDLGASGDIHLGYNISSYAWDGTDDYGDALANGVYIYQVVTRFPNETPALRDENISQYFKNGFGKLYLMR
jgi:Peptidase family C25